MSIRELKLVDLVSGQKYD